jgi:acyl-CoA synthetase (AMP-forming)/AMP-acid ligase II
VSACVVLKPGMNVTAEALIGHCRERLANYKVPRHLEFSETDLPKNGAARVP